MNKHILQTKPWPHSRPLFTKCTLHATPPSPPPPPLATMDGGDESKTSLYRILLDRCQSLEASHEKLKEQLSAFLQEKSSSSGTESGRVKSSREEMTSDSGGIMFDSSWACVPGAYFSGSPYRNVLECMGHAVHISRAGSGEIIYWNHSAEKLYGYKDYEVLGQRVASLLVDEQHHALERRIMDRLNSGLAWSGQFPFKKRSGQIFMALVTESPLYEDGELVGVITVSSDAAGFNNLCSKTVRLYPDHADGQSRTQRINLNRIQCQAKPQIAASVSNLAMKVLLRKRGENEECKEDESELETPDIKSERPPRAPATRPRFNSSCPTEKKRVEGVGSVNEESTSEFASKFISKLIIGRISNPSNARDVSIQQNACDDYSSGKEAILKPYLSQASPATTSRCCTDPNHNVENLPKEVFFAPKEIDDPMGDSSAIALSGECNESSNLLRTSAQLLRSSLPNTDVQNLKSLDVEDAQPNTQPLPNSRESTGGSDGTSSSKDEIDSNLIVTCEIRWEDLQLCEEIGHGSYAVVHRGIWNGSIVAVKVYFGNNYNEDSLLDYRKEIDIMRRLRHPNVLLFMGAVSSQEKLAVVTEFLPRGSLFKTLHKNNQQLDIKRRLRMALDVAKGMNYLHHRNPPIVHRDLKSSNLLVDKSWTVKVGDFGLSRLKEATFLTTKSGRGTPQWMAPEVLRNEPSTEKSDVFSFGVILWELMTECIPWDNLNPLRVVGLVGFMDRRLDLPENLDPHVSSIICDCWDSKPESRPSFQDIIQRLTDLIHMVTGVKAKKSPAGI